MSYYMQVQVLSLGVQFLKKNIFKYWGGKQKICDWVIDHFPSGYEKMIYIEPFCGSGIVLLNKRPSKKEYLSDTDKALFYLYRAIRERSDELVKLLENTLYSVNELNYACDLLSGRASHDDWLMMGWAKLVVCNMSFLGTGKRGALACSKARNFAADFRHKYDTLLPGVRKRLRRVEVMNKDAEKVIKQFDGSDVFFYLDPPYPDTSQEPYDGKYDISDFNRLLGILRGIEGKFLMSFELKSGMELWSEWNVVKRVIARSSKNGINNVIRGDGVRETAQEVLAMNYSHKQGRQYDMAGLK